MAFFQDRFSAVVVATEQCQEPGDVQGLNAGRRDDMPGPGKDLLFPLQRFAIEPALEPQAIQHRTHPQQPVDVVLVITPATGKAHVVLFSRHAVQTLQVHQHGAAIGEAVSKVQEVLCVASAKVSPSPAAASCSSPNSRTVSSIRKRGSASDPAV